MTVLHGVTTMQLTHKPDAPSCIEVKPTISLERFAWHGLNRDSLRTLEHKIPVTSSGPVYLLRSTQHDVSWAMSYLKNNLHLARDIVRSTTSPAWLAMQCRVSSPNRLDANQIMRLLRIIAEHNHPEEDLELYQKLHQLLVFRGTKVIFADQGTIAGRNQGLQDRNLLDRLQDTFYPVGGDDNWILSWRQHKLLVDRKNLSVFETNNNSAQAHKIKNPEMMHQWLQAKIGSIIANESDASRRWPEPIFRISAADNKIVMPGLGGIGDLHQWEALIGGASAVAADDINWAADAALEQQPPAAWMPGMSAAMVAETKRDVEAPAQLAHSVQLHNLGSIIHTGCPTQNARLTCDVKTIRLFHPLNPFGAGPLGMSQS